MTGLRDPKSREAEGQRGRVAKRSPAATLEFGTRPCPTLDGKRSEERSDFVNRSCGDLQAHRNALT